MTCCIIEMIWVQHPTCPEKILTDTVSYRDNTFTGVSVSTFQYYFVFLILFFFLSMLLLHIHLGLSRTQLNLICEKVTHFIRAVSLFAKRLALMSDCVDNIQMSIILAQYFGPARANTFICLKYVVL